MGQFRARDVKIRADYDSAFVEALAAAAANAGFPAGNFGERNPKLDHGTMVPLYYVNHFYRNYLLVRVGLSGLPLTEHYRLGQMIQQTADSLTSLGTCASACGRIDNHDKHIRSHSYQPSYSPHR